MEQKGKRQDAHGQFMHLVVVLRRDSTIVAEDELVGPESDMEISCKQGKKNRYGPAVGKDKEHKGKNCCVLFLKVEFLAFQIGD